MPESRPLSPVPLPGGCRMANETIITRYEKNPIIVPSQVPNANTIFNSAVVPF